MLRAVVTGEVGLGDALAEMMLAAGLAGDGCHSAAVGGVDEVGGGETAAVVFGEVGKVFADEAEPGGAGAGLEEEGVGAEEAGTVGGGALGDGVDGGYAVVNAGEEGRAEDSGVEAGGAEFAEGGEAEVGTGGAGFELAG